MKLKNETYDILKWLALIAYPALITLVGTIGIILEWPRTDAVVSIMSAFNIFFGTLLGVSSINYNNRLE